MREETFMSASIGGGVEGESMWFYHVECGGERAGVRDCPLRVDKDDMVRVDVALLEGF